jgi:aryl-alcohol dehydrogenase-like predicted oxidoreductase
MEYRTLGRSGFKVPVLSLGTGTFGGGTEFFKGWGSTDAAGASRLVDSCLDAGLNMFDSADVYSKGLAEEILGEAIKGRRDQVIRYIGCSNFSGWHLMKSLAVSEQRGLTRYVAHHSGLGARDSGLGARDSGLGTRGSGLGTRLAAVARGRRRGPDTLPALWPEA